MLLHSILRGCSETQRLVQETIVESWILKQNSVTRFVDDQRNILARLQKYRTIKFTYELYLSRQDIDLKYVFNLTGSTMHSVFIPV